jgi:predicted NBD/HSP70 family sugar kinase
VRPGAKEHDERHHLAVRRPRVAVVPSPLTHGHIRRANAWAVLQAVRATGTTSRTQISERTGLTGMSVHRLIAELRRRGLVVPAGMTAAGAVGRPSSLFRFNASIGHVVGVDVGNETTRAVLATLDGAPRARRERPTSEIEVDLGGNLRDLVRDLQREAVVRADALVGVGVGVPAITTVDGTIMRASQHHVWDGLALSDLLGSSLGRQVLVTQDDQLATLAELHRGACVGVRNAVVLDIGKGIGVGIVADGSVYAGAHSAAGRVAWIRVPAEGAVGDAVQLGSLVTADGLIRDYQRFGGTAVAHGAIDVFRADAASDGAATLAVDLFADRLGWLIAALVAVLDPERVVIGGGISGSFGRLSAGLARRLGESVAAPPPVVGSDLGPEAVVTGAIDAALQIADAWLQERIGA